MHTQIFENLKATLRGLKWSNQTYKLNGSINHTPYDCKNGGRPENTWGKFTSEVK